MIKRMYVQAMCLVIISPLLPIYAVGVFLEWLSEAFRWAFIGRKWTLYLCDATERFANRRGVRL
jgi:hypothetical protein